MNYLLILISLVLGVLSCGAQAQNIVPNGDFESYDVCPSVNSSFNDISDWYYLDPTPDYYACTYGVPTNFVRYQLPHSGQGYVGFANVESFGVKLLQPMVPNEAYNVAAYVSLGNGYKTAMTEIMIYFSQDSICEDTDLNSLPQVALVEGSGLLSDTADWMLVTGAYTALGCERYMAVNINGVGLSYYYMDDISITAVNPSGYAAMDCDSFLAVSVPNVFTPNNDGVNDRFELRGMSPVSLSNTDYAAFESVILNRWGNVVTRFKNQNVSWDGTSNGKPVPEGVYFYKVEAMRSVCGEILYFDGFVHLMR